MNLPAKFKIRRAVSRIFDQHPLFACIVARWEPIPAPTVNVMATDGCALLYNPDHIDKLTIEELTWLLLHEAGHVFLGHHFRLTDEKNSYVRNVAFDLALNDLIKDAMPQGVLQQMSCVPGKEPFQSMTPGRDAEHYHIELLKMLPPQPQQPQGGQGKGKGKGESPSQGRSKGGESSDPGQGKGEPKEQDGEGQVGEGSGGGQAEGRSQQQDRQGQSQGGATTSTSQRVEDMLKDKGVQPSVGEVRPHPSMTDDDLLTSLAEVEGEWQMMVAQAINTAKSCGNLPGTFFTKWEKTLSHPQVSWKQMLRRFMTKVTREGFSYERPNRRSCWRKDVILPTRRSRNAGKGCLIVDTSGSMSQADCDVALRELEAILKTFPKAAVTMLQCDTRTIKEGERDYKREDFPLKLSAKNKSQTWYGRGGTDLSPAFLAVKKRAREFRWAVVVTDMQWSFQSAPNPGVPFAWLAVGAEGFGEPNFGKLIHVTAATKGGKA